MLDLYKNFRSFKNLKNFKNVSRVLLLIFLKLCFFYSVTGMAAVDAATSTILVLGDSLSAEYGIKQGSGWVHLLEQKLRTEKVNVDVINASISGETTAGGKTRLPALLKQYRPTIVIIELGANDGLRGLSINSMHDNLTNMANIAKQTHAKILWVGMQLPANYGMAYTQKFAAVFPEIAKQTSSELVPFF